MLILTRNEAREFVRERASLFAACAERNPFCSPQWTLHFLDQIAREDWRVVVPILEGAGAPLMMLYARGGKQNKLAALTNYYSSLFSPIVSYQPEPQAAAASLVGQIADRRPRISTVDLSPMDGSAPEVAAVRDALVAHGWYVRQYFCFGNWYLPCEGLAFADYMASRDSKLHNTWVRKSKRFRPTPSGDARVELVTDLSDVERAMDAYDAVYAQSWKQPEPFPDFVRGWARICAREGWLRLGLAWLRDVPIAAQFWFTVNRKAYIYKLAYDEEHAKLSAGTVLTAELFRQALDVDKVTEIDYLTGDDAYKRSWMSHRRERTGMLACNPATANGLLLIAREMAGEVRHRLRRSSVTSAVAEAGAGGPVPGRDHVAGSPSIRV